MRAPGVGHRGAKGCQRRSRMGQGMPIWPVKGAQVVPKWIQNGPGHGQSTSSENTKKTIDFSTPNGSGASPEPPKMRSRGQMAGLMAGQRPPMSGQVAGQVVARARGGILAQVMWQVRCWPGSRAVSSGRSGGRSGPVKGPGSFEVRKSLRYI